MFYCLLSGDTVVLRQVQEHGWAYPWHVNLAFCGTTGFCLPVQNAWGEIGLGLEVSVDVAELGLSVMWPRCPSPWSSTRWLPAILTLSCVY